MRKFETILVTGGAGFIGSALVRFLLAETELNVINVDKLTYAGNLSSLGDLVNHSRHRFEQIDICDTAGIKKIFEKYQPDAVAHLAAESHVDRSIDGPGEFINTNVVGTCNLLGISLDYWRTLSGTKREHFIFQHISTDEVFGSLGPAGAFTEDSPYSPNSPYSASKAASDHFVRAWSATFDLPVTITNCSNNYGPYQFPEKFIPVLVIKALDGQRLPIYGNGRNVRDWLYVEDHVEALWKVITLGKQGETYNIGGGAEMANIDVAKKICEVMDQKLPSAVSRPHFDLVEYVTDRPGHDFRYAIDPSKISRELGWSPKENFDSGIAKTVSWYLDNSQWWQDILEGNSVSRLGTIAPIKESVAGNRDQ